MDFKQLRNDASNRSIRAVIPNGSKHIRVYEPSAKDVEYVLDAQEEYITQDGYKSSAENLIRDLYPRFTDITGLDEMTDEEIGDVIANPSIALMTLKTEIESILSEIYMMLVSSSRNQMVISDFEMQSMEIQKESSDRIWAMASKYSDDAQLPDKIDKAREAISEAYDAQEVEDLVKMLEITNSVREAQGEEKIDINKDNDSDKKDKGVIEDLNKMSKEDLNKFIKKYNKNKEASNSENVEPIKAQKEQPKAKAKEELRTHKLQKAMSVGDPDLKSREYGQLMQHYEDMFKQNKNEKDGPNTKGKNEITDEEKES